MNDLELRGCTPEPLMSYLKALGVFRLVAEQADASARLSWRAGVAVLHTKLDRDGLVKFFTDDYRPTPILAPWNGGSGFYDGGVEPLNAIAASTVPRLALYRETIARLRAGVVPPRKPKDDDKESLLVRCRAELADEAVPWLDACFVLGEDRPGYFPLLGTGGNDGRLDFTNNFMQRVADVVSFADGGAKDGSADFLAAALFADTLVSLDKAAVGQFNPGGIGGANGIQGKFEADSRVNPWDFVLMIEGAVLFAGAVARRMGTAGPARAVFPFTVESVAVGYASATAGEETTDGSRAELWLPLWDRPFTFAETRHLFGEGRAQVGRRQAKNAVEFALAANLLGVSRGVSAFARYGFLKRNGLAFLAAPLGRIAVQLRPDARLLDDPPLTDWVNRLRRACNDKGKTPARYQAALRGIDRAMFEFANRSEQANDKKYLLAVLRAVGRAERTLAHGLGFCEDNHLRPLTGLSPQWLTQADDHSPEFGLAAALAGIRGSGDIGPIRAFLEEVEVTKFVNWSPGSTSAVWSQRPLAGNLAAVFRRRLMEAMRQEFAGVPLDTRRFATRDQVLAFLNGDNDDDKLSDLLWGLIAVDWSRVPTKLPPPSVGRLPVVFGIPRLVVGARAFTPKWVNDRAGWKAAAVERSSEANAKPDPDVFHTLASGRGDALSECVTRAARRLKSGGLIVNGYRNRGRSGKPIAASSPVPAERLLAAMLFPLSNRDLGRIATSVLYPPEPEE